MGCSDRPPENTYKSGCCQPAGIQAPASIKGPKEESGSTQKPCSNQTEHSTVSQDEAKPKCGSKQNACCKDDNDVQKAKGDDCCAENVSQETPVSGCRSSSAEQK